MAAPTRIGRYEIKTSLGKGGMGSLYIARDPNTARLVAVKLLSAHLDSDELKVRFEVEAKALAQLNHPNIVDIYDSGQFRGSPFIVMEYVRGETLDEMIRRSAPLSEARKLRLIAQLCAGLAHAHEAGVVHRDIKPANLMVEDRSQRLKIVDFGIARVTEGLTRIGKMTRVNMQIGTPGYMSPEQVEGEALDHRSDIFAVGVVLYELLTNTTAFPGNSTRQIEKKVLEEQPPALHTVVPGLDPAVQAIVDKALQKDPAERYQSATEFAEALDNVHERLARAAIDVRASATPSPVTPVRPSPAPVAKGSRADVAFQRSQDAYTEGAVEAAKRFAVEALVEDAGHEAARLFLKKVDPQRWVPPPPPKPSAVPPTQVARPLGPRGTELAEDDYDATIVSPRPLAANWESTSSDAGSQEWDPFARTVVVRPGQSAGSAPWPTGHASEDSGEVDLTALVPHDEESGGGWHSSRADANPYERTIIAPPSTERKARRNPGRAQSPLKRRPFPFPWTAVAWSAAAVVVIALAAAATWFLLFREVEGVRLTIEKPEGGTITMGALACGSGGSDCTGAFELETLLEFEATPDEGFRFTGFSGDCAPGGRTRMTGPRSCAATFEKIPEAPTTPKARLTVSRTTGGTVVGSGIKCGSEANDCSVEYDVGTVVTLTVLADEGYTFRGFMGDCGTGRTFSAAITKPLDCGIRFTSPPLKTAGGAAAGSPAAGSGGSATPDTRTGGGPAGGGAARAPNGGGNTTASTPGAGSPTETERGSGGRVEKGPATKAPITAEEHAKEMEALARSDIEKTLAALPPAYADLDFPAIQRLFPTAPSRIGNQFRQYDELEYTYAGKFDFKQLDWAAGRAVVAVDVKQVITPKAGKKQEGEYVVTFDMYKRDDTWLIAKFATVPKK